jgi:hypothetical protein
VKPLAVLLAVCAALVAAGPSAAAGRVVERGVVQSVGPAEVVLRALDGSEVTVSVGAATRVRLNGRPSTLAAVQRGFVAEAVITSSGRTVVVRAFGRVTQPAVEGQVVRLGPRLLVIRNATGARLRAAVTPKTRVWRGGARVALRVLRAGMQVQVVRAPNGSALIVLVLARVGG